MPRPHDLALAWAFARHIAPSKMARRVYLTGKRQIYDRLGTHVPADDERPKLRRPPAPIFPPRTECIRIDGGDAELRFVGLSRPMPLGRFDWGVDQGQLWRMHLHYLEFLEALDDAAWAIVVDDWLRHNGAFTRGAWQDSWNSYTISIRTVVLLQELVRRDGRLPRALAEAVEQAVLRQVAFLFRNLETDIGGNHLIKDLKALIWAGTYFDGPAAGQWLRAGTSRLRDEVAAQILADGVHYERSLSYHSQVLADLLECRHALGAAGAWLDAPLERMAQALCDLSHPDGFVIQFNDAGLGMAYSPADCLSAFERVTGRQVASRADFAFPEAGYYGLRRGDLYFVIDCGRIAPDDLPAHGHADILSFELSLHGRRVVVDQGVFEYRAGPRRAFARSAAAHNSLSILGRDQAEFFGSFRCGRRPDVAVLHHEAQDGRFAFAGSHDGYAHDRPATTHQRSVELADEALVIRDRLTAPVDRPVSIGLLLHPAIAVAERDGALALSDEDGPLARLTASVRAEVHDAVWWPDLGCEMPTRRIVLRPGNTTLDVVTRLELAIR